MDENKKELSKIWFPEGTKIKLNHMNDQTKPVPEGTIGTVKFVDDEGTIHMQWENGSSLALILGEDDFEVVEENTMEKPFSRTILYYKNFAFGNNDQVYESSIKELKKEIETSGFIMLKQILTVRMKKVIKTLLTGQEWSFKSMIWMMKNLLIKS